jgi:hypothetical protein
MKVKNAQIKHITAGVLVNDFNTLHKGDQFIILDHQYKGQVFTIQRVNRPGTKDDADRIVDVQHNGKKIQFTQQFLKERGRKLKSKLHEKR